MLHHSPASQASPPAAATPRGRGSRLSRLARPSRLARLARFGSLLPCLGATAATGAANGQLVGASLAWRTIDGGGALHAAKPGGGSWSTLSDRRTKHDIAPMTGALATLLALRGMTFEHDPAWIEAGLALPGRQMGFVAQDVQQVLPEWVETLPDGTLCVTERGATALVVEAMRELASRNAALETELRELRAAVQALSRRVGQEASDVDVPVGMDISGTDDQVWTCGISRQSRATSMAHRTDSGHGR